MTQCPSCKNMVQSGITICPICGSSISQTPSSTSSYSLDADALPYGEELPFIEYAAPISSTVSTPPIVEPTTEQKTDFVTTAVPDAAHLYYAKPVATPLPHRARSIGTIALLGLLSLLLIVSTGGFSYYAAVVAPDDLHAQATSVAQTYLTAQVRDTEQAQTQAINKLLAMDPQALYNQVTSGTPIIDDPLTGPGGNTWFDYNDGDIGDCHFSNNAYHVRTSNAGDFFCEPLASFFKNMVFQVKMTIVKGDRGGLMFDLSSSGYYSFTTSSEGDYVFLMVQNSQETLLRSSFSPAATPGLNQPNLLTVIAIAHHFYLYINQSFVVQILDDTYSSGLIALQSSMNTGQGNMDVAFSNVKIWGL